MNINNFFCVSGRGYLEGITFKQDKMVARIHAITASDQSRPVKDDVWIDCEVPGVDAQRHLEQLLNSAQAGNSIILAFMAEYDAFIDACAGQTQEDPDHLVILQGKLIGLGDCYVNGALLGSQFSPKAALA